MQQPVKSRLADRPVGPVYSLLLPTLLALLSPSPLPALEPPPFVRGDVDATGHVDLSDAVSLLVHLFSGESPPPCLQAADVNADATLDLSDPVTLLSFLFLGRGEPPPPFPTCDHAPPGETSLSCEEFEPCSSYRFLELRDSGASLSSHLYPTVVMTPRGPEHGSIATVNPEMFDALHLLAPGEPVLALQGTPGFDEFASSSETLSRLRADAGDGLGYVPTVAISRGLLALASPPDKGDLLGGRVLKAGGEAPSFLFDEGVLEDVTRALRDAGVLEPGSRIVGAEPPEVLEGGTTSVLLTHEKSDGLVELLSCILTLLLDEQVGDPMRIAVKRKGGGEFVTAGPDECKWVVKAPDLTPAKSTKSAKHRTWSRHGWDLKETRETELEKFGEWKPESHLGGDGWCKVHGMGPWHFLLTGRKAANCLSPRTAETERVEGSLKLSADAICFSNGAKHLPPAEWEAEIHHYIRYQSAALVDVETGGWCHLFGPNEIEAIAQDEARCTAYLVDEGKEEVLFNKAVRVGKSNDVTVTIGLKLGINLSHSAERGVAKDVEVALGYSETIKSDTGVKDDILNCSTKGKNGLPVELRLESHGATRVNGYNSTTADALVTTRTVVVCYVLKSLSKMLPKAIGGRLICPESLLDDASRDGSAWFQLHGISDVTWKDIDVKVP